MRYPATIVVLELGVDGCTLVGDGGMAGRACGKYVRCAVGEPSSESEDVTLYE
jgi:hypothetical protein